MQSILLYSCETWPARVADERMLEVFDNDCIRRIVHMWRRDCVPTAELRHRLRLTSIPTKIAQRRLFWFGHSTRRPDGEVIKDLFLPTPQRTWRKRVGGQMKTWTTTIKSSMEPLSEPWVLGYARWRKDWAKVWSELVQDRRALSATIRHVVSSIGDAGSTRPQVPPQVPPQVQIQVKYLFWLLVKTLSGVWLGFTYSNSPSHAGTWHCRKRMPKNYISEAPT